MGQSHMTKIMAVERKHSVVLTHSKCFILFYLSYLHVKLCASQPVTPIPLLCSVSGFDYFNLTASIWSLNLNKSTCLSPKTSAESLAQSQCSLLIAFCHDLSDVGPCERSSVCQRSPEANLSLGMYTHNPFSTDVPSDVHGLQAKFENGDPYFSTSQMSCQLRTLITLTCNHKAKWLVSGATQSIREAPPPRFLKFNAETCEMNIQFDYAGACKYESKKEQIGPGTIVVLVFSISFFLYIAIGSMVGLSQGRVGAEIIPHHDFWLALPSLIKDGCEFTFCHCFSNRPSSSSYNAI